MLELCRSDVPRCIIQSGYDMSEQLVGNNGVFLINEVPRTLLSLAGTLSRPTWGLSRNVGAGGGGGGRRSCQNSDVYRDMIGYLN